MHETDIMRSALEAACAHAKENGASKITEIRLRIGTLSGVVPEALQFAFGALRDGTMARTARLEIELVPARAQCPSCGTGFEAETPLAICPTCGTACRKLQSGRELEIASVDVA